MKRIILSLIVSAFVYGQNVGIGTATPSHKLHVNGDVRVSTLSGTGTRPVYATNQGVLTTSAPNPDVFWRTTGNTGITTANFLGTINNADLNIRTNNTLRFRIENWGSRLRANDNGSAGAPNYSWISDTDIGMYRITTNTLGFSTAGVERFRLETGEAVINEGGYNYDFRVETNNQTHGLFVDGGQDVIGIRTIPTGPWVITGTPVNEIFYPMEIGSITSHDHQATIGYWRGTNVEINPETDWYGYVGYSTEAWYRGYSYGWNNVSDRSKKTNIIELNNNEPIASIILNDIENLNPTLYNYKGEKEFPKNNYDTKVRYQYHLGLLADEVPAYVADESFSAVNIYNLATLAATGAKFNLQAVKKLQQYIAPKGKITIQDFGTESITSNSYYVEFNSEFSKQLNGKTPTIILNSNNPNVKAYVSQRTDKGFYIKIQGNINNPIIVDWEAKAFVNISLYPQNSGNIDTKILNKVKPSKDIIQKQAEHFKNIPSTVSPME